MKKYYWVYTKQEMSGMVFTDEFGWFYAVFESLWSAKRFKQQLESIEENNIKRENLPKPGRKIFRYDIKKVDCTLRQR